MAMASRAGSRLIFATLLAFLSATAIVEVEGQKKTCTVNCKRTGELQNVTCALDPESVEGPYYLPLHLLRNNIIEDRTGIPLKLHLTVVDSNTCEPLPNATVDIWHADALGVYSGYVEAGASTPNTTFLRGIQVTDKDGDVTFETIYPGWYPDRCIHIHVEVYLSGALKHTGQLYFPEAITESSRAVQPYASRNSLPLSQAKDAIFRHNGGEETTFENVQGDIKGATGLVATMYIGIDPEAATGRSRKGRSG